MTGKEERNPMALENLEEYNTRQYAKKRDWHRAQAQLPIKEKMRLMLEMQKRVLPMIARRRPLKWHENRGILSHNF